MTDTSRPPPRWPQRPRAGLPFPPGRDDDRFEVWIDRQGDAHHINLRTLECYREAGGRWDAPHWWALSESVRCRLHALSAERRTSCADT